MIGIVVTSLSLCLAQVQDQGVGGPQTWTDVSGKHQVRATFFKADSQFVWLKGEQGKLLRIQRRELAPANLADVNRMEAATSIAAPTVAPAATSFELRGVPDELRQSLADGNRERGAALAQFWLASHVQPEAQATEQAGRIFKHIYVGCWGTFHLVDKWGTAVYCLGGKQYLALLQVNNTPNPDYLFYTPFSGDADTTMWAIARRPHGCRGYAVYRKDRNNKWHLYEYTCRTNPH